MRNKIIGILGGMGPESTVALYQKIIKVTPVHKEQDHLRVIIDSNPQIPDRTEAILGIGQSPLEELQKTAQNLEKSGVEIIAIPCNSAHYYYRDIQKSVNIPILNMIEETAGHINKELPHVKKIGLLSTTGTIRTKIYHSMLNKIEVLTPDSESQKLVMDAIYGKKGIKAGNTKGQSQKKVLEVAKLLIELGAEAIIAGCTEISLVLKQKDLPVQFLDSLDILAKSVVQKARINS